MKKGNLSFVLFISAVLVVSILIGCDMGASATPTATEKNMPEYAYWNPDFSPLPAEVQVGIDNGPIDSSRALAFENINDLLNPGYLDVENGYCLNPDKTGFVAVKIDFPNATGDMIQWWFWWHANKNIRYKIWCPGSHMAVSVKDDEQQNDPLLSYEERRINNTHYPIEDTGTGYNNMVIRFVSPEEFGFDTSKFSEAGIEAAICAVVGYRIAGVSVEHTYMVHLFRKNGDGMEMRSRFWLGKAISATGLQNLVMTEDTANKTANHCAHEYSHLAEFLPAIYQEFKDESF